MKLRLAMRHVLVWRLDVFDGWYRVFDQALHFSVDDGQTWHGVEPCEEMLTKELMEQLEKENPRPK